MDKMEEKACKLFNSDSPPNLIDLTELGGGESALESIGWLEGLRLEGLEGLRLEGLEGLSWKSCSWKGWGWKGCCSSCHYSSKKAFFPFNHGHK